MSATTAEAASTPSEVTTVVMPLWSRLTNSMWWFTGSDGVEGGHGPVGSAAGRPSGGTLVASWSSLHPPGPPAHIDGVARRRPSSVLRRPHRAPQSQLRSRATRAAACLDPLPVFDIADDR
ncbi:hypothetical protein GCM10027282_23610 [Frigoribacterium salinisoli]